MRRRFPDVEIVRELPYDSIGGDAHYNVLHGRYKAMRESVV